MEDIKSLYIFIRTVNRKITPFHKQKKPMNIFHLLSLASEGALKDILFFIIAECLNLASGGR